MLIFTLLLDMELTLIKHIQIVRRDQDVSDALFWRVQSYEDRLRALEEIRTAYHQWKYDDQPRFQRVYRITQRK